MIPITLGEGILLTVLIITLIAVMKR